MDGGEHAIRQYKLKRCKYGWMLFAGPYIGKCLDLYGQYSESEVSLMRNFVNPGNTVIDVGANIGDLTLPLAQMVGDNGRVYAVESHPEVFNVLCGNLALNGIGNVKPINAFIATSDKVDVGSKVWGPTAYVGTDWEPQFMALDEVKLEALHLVKIDVDGKELEVLKSGAMQIERFRPVLYFENDIREESEALLGFAMKDMGYNLYWHPAPIFDPVNFFGNPQNHWSTTVVSLMIVGLPREKGGSIEGLRQVASATEWWDGAKA
jgi:FkbM family methyltransferase